MGLFAFTAVVYIPSDCYPKSSSLSHFLLSPLPDLFVCLGPFVYFIRLLKGKIQIRHFLRCLWNYIINSPSVQIFVFLSTWASSLCGYQLYFLSPPFFMFLVRFQCVPIKPAEGIWCSTSKQNSCFLQWAFKTTPSLIMFCSKILLFFSYNLTHTALLSFCLLT